jgi:hypothetical protein
METFYVKRGRRYVPVLYGNEAFNNAMPAGTHLVVVQPGIESRIYNIQPDAAPLLAAAKLAEDTVLVKMREIATFRPEKSPLTPEQKEVWNHLLAVMGEDSCFFTYPSLKDIYDALIAELVRLTDENIPGAV